MRFAFFGLNTSARALFTASVLAAAIPTIPTLANDAGTLAPSVKRPAMPVAHDTVSIHAEWAELLEQVQKHAIDWNMQSDILSAAKAELAKHGVSGRNDDPQTHILFVRVFGNDQGHRHIHSIEFLASGTNWRDAMVESFAKTSSVSRLVQGPGLSNEYGIFVNGRVLDGEFRISTSTVGKDMAQELRTEGEARLSQRESLRKQRELEDARKAEEAATQKRIADAAAAAAQKKRDDDKKKRDETEAAWRRDQAAKDREREALIQKQNSDRRRADEQRYRDAEAQRSRDSENERKKRETDAAAADAAHRERQRNLYRSNSSYGNSGPSTSRP